MSHRIPQSKSKRVYEVITQDDRHLVNCLSEEKTQDPQDLNLKPAAKVKKSRDPKKPKSQSKVLDFYQAPSPVAQEIKPVATTVVENPPVAQEIKPAATTAVAKSPVAQETKQGKLEAAVHRLLTEVPANPNKKPVHPGVNAPVARSANPAPLVAENPPVARVTKPAPSDVRATNPARKAPRVVKPLVYSKLPRPMIKAKISIDEIPTNPAPPVKKGKAKSKSPAPAAVAKKPGIPKNPAPPVKEGKAKSKSPAPAAVAKKPGIPKNLVPPVKDGREKSKSPVSVTGHTFTPTERVAMFFAGSDVTLALFPQGTCVDKMVQKLDRIGAHLQGENHVTKNLYRADFLTVVKEALVASSIKCPDYLGHYCYSGMEAKRLSHHLFNSKPMQRIENLKKQVLAFVAIFHAIGPTFHKGIPQTARLSDILAFLLKNQDHRPFYLVRDSVDFCAEFVYGLPVATMQDIAVESGSKQLRKRMNYPIFSFAYLDQIHKTEEGLPGKFNWEEHKLLMKGHIYEFSRILGKYISEHRNGCVGFTGGVLWKWEQCYLTDLEKKVQLEDTEKVYDTVYLKSQE